MERKKFGVYEVRINEDGYVDLIQAENGDCFKPYRACSGGGWDLDLTMTYEAFRAAVRRGTASWF